MEKFIRHTLLLMLFLILPLDLLGQKIVLNNIETKYKIKNAGVFDYKINYKRTLGIYQNGFNETLNSPLWDAKIDDSEKHKDFLEDFRKNTVTVYPYFFTSKFTNRKRFNFKFESEILNHSSWFQLTDEIFNYLTEQNFDNLDLVFRPDIVDDFVYDKNYTLHTDVETVEKIIETKLNTPIGYSIIPFFIQVQNRGVEYLVIEIHFYKNATLQFKSSITVFADLNELKQDNREYLFKEIVNSLFHYL